jgi:hypothetical protein
MKIFRPPLCFPPKFPHRGGILPAIRPGAIKNRCVVFGVNLGPIIEFIRISPYCPLDFKFG